MLIESSELISKPDVSVIIITYNQEKTIAQTIESILMQNGDFTLELIIGEDCSTDNTVNICKAYQQNNSQQIRLLSQDENQGIVKNFIDTIRLCRGNYIAICAGDDYWIDHQKIAKQLAFFLKNPDYGVVSTGGYKLLVEKNKLIEGIAPLNPLSHGQVFDLTWRGGVYAMPLSLLIRAEILRKIDFDEFIKRNFSVEDVPLQAIMSKLTKYGHITDLCVVYRVYKNSQTFVNFNHPKYIYYHKGLVEIRRYLYELFPGEVEFSDEWAYDYMKYREFLQAVYQLDFQNAISALNSIIVPVKKSRRAQMFIRTKVGFYAFALVKRYKLWKSQQL